jgi:hypothetical protein
MNIDDVLNTVKSTMQAESRLSSITTYHLVDGMIPGVKPCVSISCPKLRYEDYDSDQDEVHATLRIYVYLHHIKAEIGEQSIRQLVEEVRYTLLDNQYLDGLVDTSTVSGVMFESAESQQSQVLHYALIDYEVKYYAPRLRPADIPPPTVDEIDATLNDETTIINWLD